MQAVEERFGVSSSPGSPEGLPYEELTTSFIDTSRQSPLIDLLRDGETVFEMPKTLLAGDRPIDYAVCVKRRQCSSGREIYPVNLRDRLPVISIPLREEDDDLTIDLQRLIDRVYETGRYWMTEYSEPPSPGLSGADAAWVQERLDKYTA